jgi:hypothetical protein
MGNVVYSKDAAGKIKETAIVERVFDLEEVKKFKVQVAVDKQKTQEDFDKRMKMIVAEERKIDEILVEAEKLGLIVNEAPKVAKPMSPVKPKKPVIATVEQAEASVKAEAAIEEKIV